MPRIRRLPYGAHLHNASGGLEQPCQQALVGEPTNTALGQPAGVLRRGTLNLDSSYPLF